MNVGGYVRGNRREPDGWYETWNEGGKDERDGVKERLFQTVRAANVME